MKSDCIANARRLSLLVSGYALAAALAPNDASPVDEFQVAVSKQVQTLDPTINRTLS
ncbi:MULTISPECIES: hypothetical protein [Pseudomonas]|uniref:hypothetical protein n=1 Tax=Pseudomonas TaxID=286 RepID=UPI00042699E0|nr:MULTISPECIES: hypothetical protein [Pseudomonas]MDT8922246.1 hypothetical protein [Pseudomonas taiwanensis]QQZ35098.1 hypothetical protein IF103_17920 [Pseudomonas sp. SK2]WEZ87506.1 hypothetical protein P3R38_18675 [Pseudomonas sp. NyZ480]